MNNERFVLVLCALAGVAITAFLVGVSFAHHKGEYRGMDDRLQNDLPANVPENHISANWAITPTAGSAVTWFTDDHLTPTPNPAITPIAPLVRTSIAKWATALPQLEYAEVSKNASDSAKDNASIIFKSSCGTSIGSFDPIERTPIGRGSVPLPAWHHDDVRNANYWTRARICVNVASFSNDVDIVSAISHELGHAYGLGEAYKDKRKDADHGSCGDGPLTIMDGTNSDGSHCAGKTGPTGHDINLVKGLFTRGGVSDFTATNNQDGTATFTWKDNAWGEISHDVSFRYSKHTPDYARVSGWTEFDTYGKHIPKIRGHKEGIGGHKDIPETTTVFSHTVDLSTHQRDNAGVILPDNSYYKACGRAYFQQFQTYGETTCSDLIRVSNDAHNASITPTPTPTPSPTPTPVLTPAPLPAPSGLKGKATKDGVQLTWIPPVNTYSVTQSVVRRTVPSRTFEILADDLSITAKSYLDEAPAPGFKYVYRIEAFNERGKQREVTRNPFRITVPERGGALEATPETLSVGETATVQALSVSPVWLDYNFGISGADFALDDADCPPSVGGSDGADDEASVIRGHKFTIEACAEGSIAIRLLASADDSELDSVTITVGAGVSSPLNTSTPTATPAPRPSTPTATPAPSPAPAPTPFMPTPTSTPTPTPEASGEIQVDRTRIALGERLRVSAIYSPPDLPAILRVTSGVSLKKSCRGESGSENPVSGSVGLVETTFRGCSAGDSTVALQARGEDIDSVSITVVAPTPTATAAPPTPTPTPSPAPVSGTISASKTELRIGEYATVRGRTTPPNIYAWVALGESEDSLSLFPCSGIGGDVEPLHPNGRAERRIYGCSAGTGTVYLRTLNHGDLASMEITVVGPTATPTPMPTATPAPAPTLTPAPTQTPTPMPTLTPTPTRTPASSGTVSANKTSLRIGEYAWVTGRFIPYSLNARIGLGESETSLSLFPCSGIGGGEEPSHPSGTA